MRFIDLWSEFTPNNVPNRALYKLNDPSGAHISEAGAYILRHAKIIIIITRNVNDQILP
jgi:hypothetical protein